MTSIRPILTNWSGRSRRAIIPSAAASNRSSGEVNMTPGLLSTEEVADAAIAAVGRERGMAEPIYDLSSKWLLEHHGRGVTLLGGCRDVVSVKSVQSEVVQPRQL